MTEMIPAIEEFHISLRVVDLAASSTFYAALFGVPPKESTSRYTTFVVPSLRLNFVLQDRVPV